MKTKSLITIVALLAVFANRGWAPPPLTAFTYQGRLTEAGSPATGLYDFRLAVFDDETLGNLVGLRVDVFSVPVSNGLFTVECDPGEGVFDGSPRWLQIAVRPHGGSLTTLSPRQRLTATPHAGYAVIAGQANTLQGSLPAGQIAGTLSDSQLSANIARLNTGATFQGEVRANRFAGDGGGLTNLNAVTLGGLAPGAFWQLNGNAGTTPGTSTLGTTDNKPLEFKVNGLRALRLEPGLGSPNVIGGYEGNVVSNGFYGATIGGGGNLSYPNRVGGLFATVVGGEANTASGEDSTAMGFNTTASGEASTAMGSRTTASGGGSTAMGEFTTASGNVSTAMGTYTTASGYASTALGGGTLASGGGSTAMGATTTASGDYSTAMGLYTTASGKFSTALGYRTTASGTNSTAMGEFTTASETNSTAMGVYTTASGGGSTAMGAYTRASGQLSTAMGAYTTASGKGSTAMGFNTTASGEASTAMGIFNEASGAASTAMGMHARALHDSTFVWADSTSAYLSSTTSDQFLIRAQGGIVMQADDTDADSEANQLLIRGNTSAAKQLEIGYKTSGNYATIQAIEQSVAFRPLVLQPAGGYVGIGKTTPASALDVIGTVTATAFNPSSDRNLKEKFTPVNPVEVLAKVTALPVSRWNFKDDAATPHVGPMAQDFHAAFGVGTDDKHIATVDADGVALAAIQGLNQKLMEKDAEMQALKQRLEAIERRLCQ